VPDEQETMRAVREELDLDGIIDVHTHFLPPRMLAKVWAYFDQAGPLTGRPWPITYRFSEEDRLRTLRSFGVQRFTSLAYPHKPGMAAWLNAWTAAFAAAHPDCVHSATFYPEPEAPAYVGEALRNGARVFKAHLQVGDYDPNDPRLDAVWETLQQSGTPVVIHSGNGPAPGRFTGPEGMHRLLARYPGLVLVVAHLGMPDYSAFLDLAEQHTGVHLDTTMAFTRFTEAGMPFPRDQVHRLAALGPRILFGSDFPNIPYPYTEAVQAVLRLDLGKAWNRQVFHDNAARLLRI
jgi:uncharacterized protein